MKWLAMGLSALEEAVLIIVGIILFVVFIIWFIDSLSKAVIIKKANKNFLIGFVPIYNDYVLCQITGTNLCWFYLKVGLPILLGIMETVITSAYSGLAGLQAFVFIGYWVALSASLSKSFGRGMITTVFHFLFPQITRFVFSMSSQYVGPVGCNDIIFGSINFGKTKQDVYNNRPMGVYNYQETNNHPEYHFCPKCGNAITEYDRFCNKCGREI